MTTDPSDPATEATATAAAEALARSPGDAVQQAALVAAIAADPGLLERAPVAQAALLLLEGEAAAGPLDGDDADGAVEQLARLVQARAASCLAADASENVAAGGGAGGLITGGPITGAPSPDRVQRLLSEDALLRAALPLLPICEPALEAALTGLRRALLQRALAEGVQALRATPLQSWPEPWPDVGVALARQNFLNGFAWQLAAEEVEDVARLARRAEGDADRLTVLALYRPLRGVTGAEAAPEALARGQVQELAEEAAIAAALPALTGLAHPVSRRVRDQYEAYPHPRWRHLPAVTPTSPADLLERDGALLPEESKAVLAQPALRILVAGCGTGREALLAARRNPAAAVTGVDLSRTSLAHAARQGRALGLARVRFAQADILGLHGWEERFELIEAMGVLHHAADPEDAWRALIGLLAPGGVMRIGLHSARARVAVNAARRLVARLGLTDSPAGVRAARQAILALPAEHPAAALRGDPDFYTLAGCHNALFNAREVQYSWIGVGRMLEGLGLRFLGVAGSPAALAAFRGRFADAPIADFGLWDRLEKDRPALFGSMYRFWCGRAVSVSGT